MAINWQAVEPMAFIEDPSLLDDLKAHLRVLEAHRVDAFGEYAKMLASERAAGRRDERASVAHELKLRARNAMLVSRHEGDVHYDVANLLDNIAEYIERGEHER
jgi:hypothetical protein